MSTRVERLLAALPKGQAALIHKPENMAYLSGFTGEGALCVAPGTQVIVTDFRYTEQAEQQSPGWTVVMSDAKDHPENECLYQAAKGAGCEDIACEYDCLTVDAFAELQNAMPGMKFAALKGLVEDLREVKDEEEIELLHTAQNITADAFDDILKILRPGMTELDVARELYLAMEKHGGRGQSFPSIVASGENGSLPHAIPGNRVLQKGDMVTLDFGAMYKGYCGDFTRTVALGDPGQKLKDIYAIVLEAQLAACDALMAGKTGQQVDAVARDIIAKAGYGEHFGHGLGHGIGRLCHEKPRLSKVWTGVLKENVVVSVEPGIYVPGLGGVRIEDICVVKNGGNINLTRSPKELIIL